MITVHCIVRNEENYIKQALVSVLSADEVERVLVWDTGSEDATADKILSIKDKRIEFQQKGRAGRERLVFLRNQQIKLTVTSWMMLVDGDEIWPENNLRKLIDGMKKADKDVIALVNKTRNAAGDIYHYLPESEGRYRIGKWKGNLNIRAIKNLPKLTVKGVYPNEWYEINGRKIQDQPEKLNFVDTWYLHATHLKRSGSWFKDLATYDRWRKHKWRFEIKGKNLRKLEDKEIPEALVK